MAPSLQNEGSPRASCSCRGFSESRSTLVRPLERKRKVEPARCGCPSRPRTPAERDRRDPPHRATGLSRTRPSLAPPWSFFSAMRHTPERPADRRLAHRNPRGGVKELGPLRVGGPRPLLEVLREEFSGLLI